MLMLALTTLRVRDDAPDMSTLVLQAQLTRALQIGRDLQERQAAQAGAMARAHLGQLLGRCLLAAGHEEDAEECFGALSRTYVEISRPHVRWLSGLDQGVMALHLNRPARAAQAFSAVADDATAEPLLRIEAMAGAALAWQATADGRRAQRALQAARALAVQHGAGVQSELIDLMAAELAVLQHQRAADALDDHALRALLQDGRRELPGLPALAATLAAGAQAWAARAPLLARRLQYLAVAAEPGGAPLPAGEFLAWVRERRLAGLEPALRVEAALLLLAQRSVHAAAQVVAVDGEDEAQLQGHRHALELHYVQSRVCLARGRTGDALRHYARHAGEAVQALQSQAQRRCTATFVEADGPARTGVPDAECARLPLRYRRAVQFIVEHLHDDSLSVQRVAGELGVTERALQMAFRAHLGLSPAEFIRTRRVERVREDLTAQPGDVDLAALAQRHGIRNRSTLSSNYRARFQETPMQTLRGARPGAASL